MMMTIKYDQISEAIRPLKLTEVVSDPTAVSGDGYLYTKEENSQTELFYMDELAQVIQLSRDGYLNTPFCVLPEETNDPDAVANTGFIYSKDDGGDTELFFLDNSGNAVQITKDGAVNAAASGNTLDAAYDQGGAGAGRAITADSGAVQIDASGGEALEVDGYVSLIETTDPGAAFQTGMIYTKDDGGDTELFYLDDSGNAVQITKDGVVNAVGAGGNTLDAAYDQGGAGAGRSITADSGPVFIDASGGNALHIDGYLKLDEISDPAALGQAGMLYSKDVGGDTELFYLDDSGNAVQLTEDGYLATFNSVPGVGMWEQGGDPTPATDKGFMYTKDDGGDTELFYMDDSGDVVQITQDGYLAIFNSVPGVGMFEQLTDPSPATDKGFIYSKDDGGGATELFYLDDSGNAVQITAGGALANMAAGDDTLNSTGSETDLVLSSPAAAASGKASGYDLDVFRNGVLMKYTGTLGSNKMEWTYTPGTQTVSFVASGASDWYRAVYRA